MLLSEQAYKKIDRELAKFPADRKMSACMGALAIAQDEHGWLSPELMQEVADYLDMPAIAVTATPSRTPRTMRSRRTSCVRSRVRSRPRRRT